MGRAAASRSAPRLVAFVADLLAALLAAGAAPEHAIAAVSAAVDAVGSAPLRAVVEPLARTGRLLELGTEPSDAWAGLARHPEYREIALAGQRCARSGARLSGALATAAAQLRMARRTAAVERATAVGVWAMLPLGVCFLPAFVCLGVVPVVIGIAGPALAGAQ